MLKNFFQMKDKFRKREFHSFVYPVCDYGEVVCVILAIVLHQVFDTGALNDFAFFLLAAIVMPFQAPGDYE